MRDRVASYAQQAKKVAAATFFIWRTTPDRLWRYGGQHLTNALHLEALYQIPAAWLGLARSS